MIIFIGVLYAFSLVGLSYFAIHRLKMIWSCMRTFPSQHDKYSDWTDPYPSVCVQCPIYNEPLVVEELLEKVSAISWKGDLEIQILDDSTDETSQKISQWLSRHPDRVAKIHHLRRDSRANYKAGALIYGMSKTKAEYIAILDADFRPQVDFVEKLMPYFRDPKVGVVQARWEFCNRNASLLTWMQGIVLDVHFVIEQTGRCESGFFFNFNGTAGIWRRRALEDGGNWSADTVTEDLDASYHAQRKGWRFVYTKNYAVPSELPESIIAYKSQQRRWTKGGMQVARRQLRDILYSDLSWRIKAEACCHLTIGFSHSFVGLFAILLAPYLIWVAGTNALGPIQPILIQVALVVVVVVPLFSYFISQMIRTRSVVQLLKLIILSPVLIAFFLVMSLTCSFAVFEGLFSDGGEFVRTPKGGNKVGNQGLIKALSGRSVFKVIIAAEILVGVCMFAAAIDFGTIAKPIAAIILALTAAGFLSIAYFSVREIAPPRIISR